MNRRSSLLPAVLAGVIAVGDLVAGAAAAQNLRPVTFVADWIPSQPQHLAYWLAKSKGYYAENGLDVTIQGSRGSNLVLQLVVADKAEFGSVSAPGLVQAVAKQDAPVKMVGVYFQKDTTAIAWFESSGIKSVKDLEGKQVGIVPGTLQFTLWPSFAKAAGLDVGKVKLVNSDFRLIWAQWGAKQFDASGNFLLGGIDAERYEKDNEVVKATALSDYLPILGHGIVTTTSRIEKDPALVKAFVKATQKAWAYMVADPVKATAEAAQVVGANVEQPASVASIAKYALAVIPSRMISDSTRGKPLGWSDPVEWNKMVDVLAPSGEYPKKPAAADLMTNQFVEQ